MGKGGASKGGAKGKGKGGGDHGRGAPAASGGGQYADTRSPEEKRQAKKSGRRNAQMAKLDEKGQAEADYFWECKARSKRTGTKATAGSAVEIFGRQGTFAIDFTKYDSVEVTRSGPGAESAKALHDFRDLGKELPSFLAQNLEKMSYRVPTPIQKHAIPLAMRGSDLMCCAQTGSGKTAAFLLPVVASLGAQGRYPAWSSDDVDDPALPRCVIMAPTRELIQQIHVEALKCCHNSGGLRAVVIYGGAQAKQQLAELGQGCDIAVATPGRLTDFVNRGLVEFRLVEHLILDEADRMLDMGFEPQIRQLVQNCDMPDVSQRWTMMFSATFPTEIQKLAKSFMKPYVFIAVGRVGGTTENIEQRLVWASADKRAKFDLLLEELTNVQGKTMVFVQKKRVATQIRKWLKAEGWTAEEIHGDRSQSQREAALAAFKTGDATILCATDVAARGLDIPKVAHVINFDLPTSPDEFDAYVHRIGRTGRAGNTGISTSFYVPGRDPKVGNAGIAGQLVQLFTETKNEVPDWFWQLPDAASLNKNGKAGGGGAKQGSSDVRGSKESVSTRTPTASAQPSAARAPDAGVPNANAIGNFESAAKKRNLQAWFEETPDVAEGFWCEAIVADSDGRELSRVESWNTKKKDAKYDAAKLGVAALDNLPQGGGARQSAAASPQTGGRGAGRAKEASAPAQSWTGGGGGRPKEAAAPAQSRTWKGQDAGSNSWQQEAAGQGQSRTWHNGQGAGTKASEETDWRARPQASQARPNAEYGQREFRPQPREAWENGGGGGQGYGGRNGGGYEGAGRNGPGSRR